MTPEEIISIASWAAAGVALLAALGEWLHARRVARLSRLAFGPDNRPRAWTRLAAPLRVLALAALVWSLVVLIAFNNRTRERDRQAAATRHLLVLLDVSPSMQLTDAGEAGSQRRADRAAQVLKSVMDRTPGNNLRFTLACFYTEARLLVKECGDRELIWHFSDGVPLYIAYQPGKTDLLKSLNQAGEFVKELPRKSTTMLVLSDGDTVAATGLRPMPSAVAQVIVAGVGEAGRGTFIDGHQSRQDSATLSQLARRLGGVYYDANTRQVPTDALRKLNAVDEHATRFLVDRRTLALLLLGGSALVLCLLPVLLEHFGSAWKPAPAGRAAAEQPSGQPVTP